MYFITDEVIKATEDGTKITPLEMPLWGGKGPHGLKAIEADEKLWKIVLMSLRTTGQAQDRFGDLYRMAYEAFLSTLQLEVFCPKCKTQYTTFNCETCLVNGTE